MGNKNILIAQIGRGNYRVCNYAELEKGMDDPKDCICKEEIYSTGYTFAAVKEKMKNDNMPVDTLLLIGTETSYWGDVCGFFYEIRDDSISKRLEHLQEKLPEIKDALHESEDKQGIVLENISGCPAVRERLEAALREMLGVKDVQICIVKKGIAPNEMDDNFSVLKAKLEEIVERYENVEKINVCFDISNGFRSIPFYVYALVNYLTRIRKEEYDFSMYYGMSEARGYYGDSSKEITPMVDLNKITHLMKWINAINEFRNFGSVKELKNIFEQNSAWNIEVGSGTERDKLSAVFEKFDYAANTNDLKELKKTIDIICGFVGLKAENTGLPEEAVVMLTDMGEEFEERFRKEGYERYPYGNLTLELAGWFCDQGRYGSAAIAMTEGMVTYLMERYEDQIKEIYPPSEKVEGKSREDWLFDHDERYYVNGLTIMYFGEDQKEIRDSYKKIRYDFRNATAHLKYKDNVNYKDVIKDTLKWILDSTARDDNAFIENLEDQKEELKKKRISKEKAGC